LIGFSCSNPNFVGMPNVLTGKWAEGSSKSRKRPLHRKSRCEILVWSDWDQTTGFNWIVNDCEGTQKNRGIDHNYIIVNEKILGGLKNSRGCLLL
jgi:hypothetical protein